jgi:hypothetical protein
LLCSSLAIYISLVVSLPHRLEILDRSFVNRDIGFGVRCAYSRLQQFSQTPRLRFRTVNPWSQKHPRR